MIRVRRVRTPLRSWHPWLMFFWSHKDGGPVQIEEAVWWKHVSSVVVARKWEIKFRHKDAR